MFNSFPQPKPDSDGSNIKSIQIVSPTIAAAYSSGTIALAAIDITKSIVMITASNISQQDGLNNNWCFGSLDSLLLTVSRIGTAGTVMVTAQVIEFKNVKSKQTGSVTFSPSASSATSAISTVNPGKSILILQPTANDTGGTLSRLNCRGTITGPNTLTFNVGSDVSTFTLTANWQLLEFY